MQRYKVIVLICLCIFILGVVYALFLHNKIWKKDRDVVAEVEGVKIHYKDIGLDLKAVLTKEECESKAMVLLGKIEEILTDKAIPKDKITVTEKEISDKVEEHIKLMQESGLPVENFSELIAPAKKLVELFKFYLEDPVKAREFYKAEFKSWAPFDMPVEKFLEYYIKNYRTAEELEAEIPKTLEDLKVKERDSARKEIETAKQGMFLNPNLSVTDDEILAVYRHKYVVSSISLVQVYSTVKGKLEEILEDIAKGASFADAISRRETDPDIWTVDGSVSIKSATYDLPDSGDKPWRIYLLSEGETSTIYKSWKSWKEKNANFPYYFVYVKKIVVRENPPPFEEVKETIKNALLRKKAINSYLDWIDQQLKKADIKIYDKRLKDAVHSYIEKLP